MISFVATNVGLIYVEIIKQLSYSYNCQLQLKCIFKEV